MKKFRKLSIFILFILIIIIATGAYIAITGRGITYKGVYSKHIKEDLSTMNQKERFVTDFDFLYEEIKNYYINLDYKEELLQINWDELYLIYKQQIEDIKSDKEFYLLCNKFLNTLKDGHTRFEVLDSDIGDYKRSIENSMRVRLIEDKGIIVAEQNEFDILGREIVSINDIEFLEIVDKMADYFSKAYDKTVGRSNIVYYNQFWDYFYYFYDTYPKKLSIQMKSPDGEEETIVIDTDREFSSMKSIQNINFGFHESDLPSLKIFDMNIGYIKIPTFSGSRSEIVNEFDSIVKEIKENKVEGVIIDIRYNKGGNQSYRDILGYLTDEPIHIVHYRMKKSKRFNEIFFLRQLYENIRSKSPEMASEEGYTKWWTWTVKPNKEQFLTTIPVVLLANEQIFSSADNFAKICLDYNLAKVVSNIVPLSGNGLPVTIALPSKKYAVTYGFMENRSVDFQILENTIEEPDIKSEQTLNDLHNGIDTQLNAAIKYIKDYLD